MTAKTDEYLMNTFGAVTTILLISLLRGSLSAEDDYTETSTRQVDQASSVQGRFGSSTGRRAQNLILEFCQRQGSVRLAA